MNKPCWANDNYMKGWSGIMQELYSLCCKYEIDTDAISIGVNDMGGLYIKTNSMNNNFLIDIHRLVNISYETCIVCGNEGKMVIDKCEGLVTICKLCHWKSKRIRRYRIFISYIKYLLSFFK